MRLDRYIFEKGLVKSRTSAKTLITGGYITVDGAIIDKPSFDYTCGEIVIGNELPYVSRGGLKLEAAVIGFGIDVNGKKCLDIGASTGGFTDCLLKNGASSVLCVDCGHGQLDPKIKNDSRVTSLEGFNARNISPDIGSGFDICVMDVSFISQTLIHPSLISVLKNGSLFVSLIKPQFESGKSALNSKGIVRDEKDRKRAIETVCSSAESCGFELKGIIDSPINGGDGNKEYLALFEFTEKNLENLK